MDSARQSGFPNMDELALRCKQQLETFRINELKDVLSRVGATKQGKKQVLLEKIMALVLAPDRRQHGPKGSKPENFSNRHAESREAVARAIDDVFRKRCGSGAADLATTVGNGSNSLVRSDEQDEVFNRGEGKTRCPCGSSLDSGMMIQCDDPKCMVWQHVNCVIIPEKEGMDEEIPSQFYCELCRIQHADPFCVAVSHPLLPVKTITSNVVSEGSSPSPWQNVETSFSLSRNDQEMLRKPNYDLQVWCTLLNDKVAFRMHWPQYADLRVNGVSVRVTNRPGQQLLGINGRDDGPVISNCTKEGANRISLSACDGRTFCVGVRVIRRLTVEQVLNHIPSETEGEDFQVALARVRRCIGGSGVGNDDDGDSDLEVVSELVTVNLRCPMSGSRMKVPGRFRPCLHMGCFDLCTFVELNQRARKWQCPICQKNFSLRDLLIDPFFNRVTKAMQSYGEDVTEVEMKPDGCWRPKLEGDAKLREPWRSPDGSISLANGENRSTSRQKALRTVKIEEGVSVEEVPLKIGIKRTRDGTWQVNGTRAIPRLASNGLSGRNPILDNRLPSRSSSATASNDEDPSVNQEPKEVRHEFRKGDAEVTSTPMEPPPNAWLSGDPELPKTSEVIVLSDTDEENTDEYTLGVGNHNRPTTSQLRVSVPEEKQGKHGGVSLGSEREFIYDGPETTLPFSELGSFRDDTTGPLDLFGAHRGALPTPLEQNNFWSSEGSHAPFEFLGSVPEASRPAPGLLRPVRPTPVQAVPRQNYALSRQQNGVHGIIETGLFDCNRATQSFVSPEYRGQPLESTRRLASADPSLQLFLPHQPARASAAQEPLMATNEDLQEGWFSLSLGGGETVGASPQTAVTAPYDVEQTSKERGRLDPTVDLASVLLDMSGHGTQPAARDSNVPAQRRSSSIAVPRSAHRQRHYFRVDSDSD